MNDKGNNWLSKVVLTALIIAGSATVSAQAIGSQAANIQFNQQWQCPSGIGQLSDYSPNYVVLLELWGIN